MELLAITPGKFQIVIAMLKFIVTKVILRVITLAASQAAILAQQHLE